MSDSVRCCELWQWVISPMSQRMRLTLSAGSELECTSRRTLPASCVLRHRVVGFHAGQHQVMAVV
jgi:hypothetical protein